MKTESNLTAHCSARPSAPSTSHSAPLHSCGAFVIDLGLGHALHIRAETLRIQQRESVFIPNPPREKLDASVDRKCLSLMIPRCTSHEAHATGLLPLRSGWLRTLQLKSSALKPGELLYLTPLCRMASIHSSPRLPCLLSPPPHCVFSSLPP